MRKKFAALLLGSLVMAQLTACGSNKAVAGVVETPVATPSEKVVDIASTMDLDYTEFTGEAFIDFFKKYFSLTEEEILILNQNPIKVTESDTQSKETYMNKVQVLLKDYLSEDAKKELKASYKTTSFDWPKKLEINEYVTYDSAVVEKVEVIAAKKHGENRMYQVAITTKNKVKDVMQANKDYVWDNDKMYYAKVADAKSPQIAFAKNYPLQKELQNTYLYYKEEKSGALDEIKLVQNYWVEVSTGSKLKIQSVKEAVPFEVQNETRQKASNIHFVTRIPYQDDVNAAQKMKVIEVLNTFLSQPKDFFSYYQKALNTGYNTFLAILKTELEIDKNLSVTESTYRQAFASNIVPYKDDIEKINVKKEEIKMTTSSFSTKYQPRLRVMVPIEVVNKNDEITNLTYEYLVGMEENKIEFIQFIRSTPRNQEQQKQ